MKIYCCECKLKVDACIVNGDKIYPHRKDLSYLKFYQCFKCKNFVGTHNVSNLPLGCIANSEIKKLRQKIHVLLDPLWKLRKMKRKEIYTKLSIDMGFNYHTAILRSVDQCMKVIYFVNVLRKKHGLN